MSGRLVAAVVPLSASASPLVHATHAIAAVGAEPVAGRAAGSSPWAVIGGVVAVLGLLGVGIVRERIDWRSLRPPWSR